MFVALGLLFGVLVLGLAQPQAGPWLFTVDKGKSKIELEVTLDLGITNESDSDSTKVEGTIIAELTPGDPPVETIRITSVDAQSTKSKLQLNYSIGPFGLLGKAKFRMSDLRIRIDPEGAGVEAEVDDDGNFIQEGNTPTLNGLVSYDVNALGNKNEGEIDFSDPDQFPEDQKAEAFTIEGQLTWDGDQPVLKFDFEVEQEVETEEFEGITVLVLASGTLVARGERLAGPPLLAIAPAGGGQLRLAWEAGGYVLEAAAEPTFAEPEPIELADVQAELIIKLGVDHPNRFFRLRSR
ncbi:MAG TPA: hypothetical protein QGH16_08895 [Verrucomicrobiota bacterium]|nr:hypothetical protein [Verrucomicrobiota bacterium]